jgi:hypothetical protein
VNEPEWRIKRDVQDRLSRRSGLLHPLDEGICPTQAAHVVMQVMSLINENFSAVAILARGL